MEVVYTSTHHSTSYFILGLLKLPLPGKIPGLMELYHKNSKYIKKIPLPRMKAFTTC